MNKRIGKADAKHLYNIGTTTGDVKVDANNRDQAARLAEKAGYVVKDVNMIG